MSGEGKHKEGSKKNKFCCIRPPNKCACGNNYKENCKPSWHRFKYPQKTTQRREQKIEQPGGSEIVKQTRELTNFRSYEAHHLLCVASIRNTIDPDASKPEGEFGYVASQTKWCVNNKKNTIALPMWSHTLRWYCSMITGELRMVQDDQGKKAKLGPPPFKNLPQHDYDHTAYIKEVDNALKKLVKDLKEVKHELQKTALKQELDSLAKKYKTKLGKVRGMRKDGTHAAWEAGLNGAEDWYLPFSMANKKKATSRAFPVSGITSYGKMGKKINTMVEAFWKDGLWKMA